MTRLIIDHIIPYLQSLIDNQGRSYILEPKLFGLVPAGKPGHIALSCFILAKEIGLNPSQISEKIATGRQQYAMTIYDNNCLIVSITNLGPYCNITIDMNKVAVYFDQQQANFGKGQNKNYGILIEGRQPNTHKEFHIGHVRNALIPESLCRIMSYAGYTVHRCCYIGDIGAHIAKRIRYYTKFDRSPIPESNVGTWAAAIYAQAGEKMNENPEEYKKQINEIHKKLEDGDPELINLRIKTRDLCMQTFQTYFDELGCNIGHVYYESDVEKPGIALVKEWEKKGIVRQSEGALIIDMQDVNLGIFVVLKSNGASLYSTKDLALAYRKEQDFSFDESIYIVATEQEHHFNQVFEALRRAGYPANKLHHLSYGMVVLPDGKMSSRKGNAITYTMLRDMVLDATKDILITKDDTDTTKAKKIALAAIKFGMLIPDTHKEVVFDPRKAVSFEGETGPYLLYTVARLGSIITKAQEQFGIDATKLSLTDCDINQEHLRDLILSLLSFPDKVQDAASQRKPNIIARRCFDTAQLINHRYHHEKILTDHETAIKRLPLVLFTKNVLTTGLDLLGIETVETM